MYIVTIRNGETSTEIQNEHHKLYSGNVVQGINTIDSFTFSVLRNNPAFGALNEFTTLVEVYNTAKRRYEFLGRVLHTTPSMSDNGLLVQETTCESYFGFLCDSQQGYVKEQNWTVKGLLTHIINYHNSRVEDYKKFKVGTVSDPNDNLYIGIQRENTWETIKKKLLDTLGGEIRFRVQSDGLYIDYVEEIGEVKTTTIELSKNMKSITKERDPSSIITRLVPIGRNSEADAEVDITSVNGGLDYIDDEEAIARYGLHEGVVEFEDVSTPSILLIKGKDWIKENNKVLVKYVITALDLSLIGLDIDDFERYNYYPIKNRLLGIDDTARINKKNINVCNETESSFEIGESFKTLSEIQREQNASIQNTIVHIVKNYATNNALSSETSKTISLIEQTEKDIVMSVSNGTVSADDYDTFKEAMTAALTVNSTGILAEVENTYATKGSLALEIVEDKDEHGEVVGYHSQLAADVDKAVFNAGEIEIKSGTTGLLSSGVVRFYAGAETETSELLTYSHTEEVTFDTISEVRRFTIPNCKYIYSAKATVSYSGGGSAVATILTPTPRYGDTITYSFGGSLVMGTITFEIKYISNVDARFMVFEDGSMFTNRGLIGGWNIRDNLLESVSKYTLDGVLYYQKVLLSPEGVTTWRDTTGEFKDDVKKTSTWHNLMTKINVSQSDNWEDSSW